MSTEMMREIAGRLGAPGRVVVGRVPMGMESRLLARLLPDLATPALLFVVRDDREMKRSGALVQFFAPEAEILEMPAWDCLPYDRVSPHRDIIAARISTLYRLSQPGPAGRRRIVIATVSALLQRLPPRALIGARTLNLAPAGGVTPASLLAYLSDNGYRRSETVNDPGEFAVRGGIVDLFPAGAELPLRCDFFGDDLESLRSFDPLTQMSLEKSGAVTLLPMSEVILDADSIQSFRSGYRSLFGAVRGDDPLYEAISDGRAYPGMEHWLPLFYSETATLFDYMPGATVAFQQGIEEAGKARLEMIREYYEARTSLPKGVDAGEGYRPLPPERLYLDADDLAQALQCRAALEFTAYDALQPDGAAFDAGGRSEPGFAAARGNPDVNLFDAVRARVKEENAAGRRVVIAGYSTGARERLATLLKEHGIRNQQAVAAWRDAEALPAESTALTVLEIESGFSDDALALISEQDILGERITRANRQRKRPENYLTEAQSLRDGDLVVHVDHGIGRYAGLEALEVGGAAHDCLKVLYQGGDRLFVPVENIEVLSRFGGEDGQAELDRLGGAGWQGRKARVKKRLKDIADQLIKIAAQREIQVIDRFEKQSGLYEEFAARFPFPETDDQDLAIADTLEDLAKGRPMDRLICGDVGFGKTEVALRAAFVVAMSGSQVAVVVPTTLLARQHYETFRARFAGLPMRIAQLSRLTAGKKAKETKDGLTSGQVDIVIGTHALLTKSIEFRDLGLLIVDEEQHFGVKQKERLKELRASVHVLTLSATPIPRTLQLAMSGVKDLSMIATPPVDRLAVRTFVVPDDPVTLREALMREHFRGGQSFYVCPRIDDLAELEERLRNLVPECKIATAHGRLSATQLEAVMSAFYDHRFEILLATNIIESGLDIPSANTLIVHRADMFGLSQLYQLRGRVGRSKVRGYAYLTLPQGRLLTDAAERRLKVMQTLDTLGAGFSLASHDLDIRGAGNLLGEEQSGHIREVGVELYQQMLEEAVARARSGNAEAPDGEEAFSPQINVGTSVLIPESYVTDLNLRLGLYRRLSTLAEVAEIESFAAELIDRFGPVPDEVENLLQIVAIKQLCRSAGVERVDAGPKGAVLTFHKNRFAAPEKLIHFIQRQAGTVQLRPDHKLVYRRNWETAPERVKGVRRLLGDLAKLAEAA